MMMSGGLGTKDSRSRHEQRSGVALRASEPRRQTVPPARKPGPALLLPQVFDGDVALLESLQNVLEVIMEARGHLEALVMEEDVSGLGAAEEGDEAEDHVPA